MTAVFQQIAYNVDEDVAGGNIRVCVAIVSQSTTSLTAQSQVTVTFMDGTASSQGKLLLV